MNQQHTGTLPISSSILNRRYEYAVGLFFERQNLESALNDLEKNGFPMQQLTVIGKSIHYVKIIDDQYYNLADINIPHDIRKLYKDRIDMGNYLVVLRGTAILIAAAKSIFQSHQINDFATFRPSLVA
ncbi:MAG: hypothetical protein AAFW70_22145 [Cyanobacteria bacterium J06635_10]